MLFLKAESNKVSSSSDGICKLLVKKIKQPNSAVNSVGF